jgi:hypothetical protein
VHGNDGFGPRRNRPLEGDRIDVVVVPDVHQYRARTNHRRAAGAGDERVGSGDDFVARPDPECSQRKDQGVGARVHADGVASPAERRELALELVNLSSEHEHAAVDDALHRLEQLSLDL